MRWILRRRRLRDIARLGYVDGWNGDSSARVGHNTSTIQAVYDRAYSRGRIDRERSQP